MRYHWDEYCLDREGALLTRNGRHVDASRKILDCITLLLEQRHRVVGHDELFRKLWGHSRVTNHQLIQIVVAARRAIGDDGQSQRQIRTISGIGYRWVGEGVTVSAETAAPEAAAENIHVGGFATAARSVSPTAAADVRPPAESATAAHEARVAAGEAEARPGLPSAPSVPASSSHPPAGTLAPSRAARAVSGAAAALMVVGCLLMVGWALRDRRPDRQLPPPIVAQQPEPGVHPTDPLALIEDRLWSGDIQAARAGLAKLPPELARSPEVELLEIRADLESGRNEAAARNLARQRERYGSTSDPVLRVKLLILKSTIAGRTVSSGEEVFDPAQQAVSLVEANPDRVPKSVAGEAYLARGVGGLFMGRFDSAIRDLVRARDILQQARDKRRVIAARHMLAHAWLRNGRLSDAADEFGRVATLSREVRHVFGEVQARNSLTRILIEQLRWEDALANSRLSLDAAAGVGDGEHRAYTMRLHAHVLTQVGRLGEAEALLRSAEAQTSHKSVSGIVHGLASGRPDGAAADSLALFSLFSTDSNANLILSSQEGMLLLWTMAAQQMAAQGRPPQPSPGQLAVLQQPQSIPGRIARGRWLLMQGAFADAEAVLAAAFEDAVDADRPFYMTLAAEPLIDLLLRRRALAEAEDVLASLRGNDPEKMDRDFRVAVIGLRVAHARGEIRGIENAYVRAVSVAGERTLPLGLRALTRTDTKSRQHLARR